MIIVNLINLFNDENIDGVGQYTKNLFKGINEIGELDKFHFIIRKSSFKFFSDFKDSMNYTLVEEPKFAKYNFYKKDFIVKFYLENIKVSKIINSLDANLVFNPFHSITSYISTNVPTVVTYHDLLYLNFKKDMTFLKRIFSNFKHKDIVKKTAFFIVPSEYVKKDLLINYQGVEEKKVTVLPNPIYIDNSDLSEYNVERKYILSVNSILPHKNMITLLKAFFYIMDDIEHNLILVGKKSEYLDSEIIEYIEKIGKDRLKITGYISNSKRNYLYKNASLFVSSSLHEGFGMTPIEAALFEIPVITTLMTSIPESSLNLLNYYDPPDDYRVLADKIIEVLISNKDHRSLSDIRKKYENKYNIESVAKTYLDYFIKIQD